MFIQLKPSVKIFSKSCTVSLVVRSAKITFNIFLSMQLLNAIQDGAFLGLRMGGEGAERQHISYNDETWHSYSLPKEDPKTI